MKKVIFMQYLGSHCIRCPDYVTREVTENLECVENRAAVRGVGQNFKVT